MNIVTKGLGVVLASIIVLGLAGCGGKEERKAAYLERGKAYLAEKNFDKAKIEFKNVLQIDPKDA
ncbi:MAG TPA: tetratricopeptide repeat protein, partial [Gammaproteobacteria bacterium]|nr:tetratricopeptide repeat protein [Gammaproteobacteria bacterium]